MSVPVPPSSNSDSRPLICYCVFSDIGSRHFARLDATLSAGIIEAIFRPARWQAIAVVSAPNIDDLNRRVDRLQATVEFRVSLYLATRTRYVADRFGADRLPYKALLVLRLGDDTDFTSLQGRLSDVSSLSFDLIQARSMRTREPEAYPGILAIVSADSTEALQLQIVTAIDVAQLDVGEIFDGSVDHEKADQTNPGNSDFPDQSANPRGTESAPPIDELDLSADRAVTRIAARREISKSEAIVAAAVVADWIDSEIENGARFYRVKGGLRRRVRFRK